MPNHKAGAMQIFCLKTWSALLVSFFFITKRFLIYSINECKYKRGTKPREEVVRTCVARPISLYSIVVCLFVSVCPDCIIVIMKNWGIEIINVFEKIYNKKTNNKKNKKKTSLLITNLMLANL